MKVHVFIVAGGRLELLSRCCRSVAAALTPECRVTVLVNGDLPEVVDWLTRFNHPSFQWEVVERESRPAARNRAFELSGDIIYFLDDDVIVPGHLFKLVSRRFREEPKLAILGGPNLTPPDEPWLGKIFGAVMTSSFAAPRVRARYGADCSGPFEAAGEHQLILCNLALRRSAVPENLRFATHLVSNEENLLLYHCKRLGLKAVFSPEAYVFHHRRRGVLAFASQVFSYGFGRAQQTLAAPRSCHPLFLVPSLTLLFVGVALPISGLRVFLIPLLIVYAALAFVAALASRTVAALGILGALFCIPITAVVHVAYGVGFLAGLMRGLRRSSQSTQLNASDEAEESRAKRSARRAVP